MEMRNGWGGGGGYGEQPDKEEKNTVNITVYKHLRLNKISKTQ